MERVRKSGQGVLPWPPRRIAAEVWQAGERAAALVACAEAEVAALRRDAEAGLERRRAEAEAQGHEAGLARAAAALLEGERRRERRLAEAEHEVAELAVDLARRLLGRELDHDPSAVRAAAVEALRAARGLRGVVLRLHPGAAAALRIEAGPLAEAAGLPSIAILADPALQPGDAVVETAVGSVDSRLEVRLAALRQALHGARS